MAAFSQWESSLTLCSLPPQRPKVLPSHLTHHLEAYSPAETDKELTLIIDELRLQVRLSWVRDFVNCCNANCDLNDVTATHLVLYIYYSQACFLRMPFYVNEIKVIHSGVQYRVHLAYLPWDSPSVVSLLLRGLFFQCTCFQIKNNPYRYFNLEQYLTLHSAKAREPEPEPAKHLWLLVGRKLSWKHRK